MAGQDVLAGGVRAGMALRVLFVAGASGVEAVPVEADQEFEGNELR